MSGDGSGTRAVQPEAVAGFGAGGNKALGVALFGQFDDIVANLI